MNYKILDSRDREELEQLIGSSGGRKTAEGGEIFNDYENNKALSRFSTTKGSNNIAGGYGYNYRAIDLVNKKIYLTAIKVTDASSIDFGEGAYYSESLDTGYAVGDKFSLVNDSHFDLCGTITNINGNEITYSQEEGKEFTFTSIKSDDGQSGYSFYVPSKPTVGTISLFDSSNTAGISNKSVGRAAHSEGRQNLSAGDYAHTEGRNNIAVYAAHAEGSNTQALGQSSHTEGYSTTASGYGSHAEGGNTTAKGENSHTGGNVTQASGKNSFAHGLNLRASQPNQFVIGKHNLNRTDTVFEVGNGKSWDPSTWINAFTVHKDGHAEVQSMGNNPNDKTVATKGYVDQLKPKKITFTNGATITAQDNTLYYADTEISSLTIIYPNTDFICSFDFTIASEGDVTITLPESKYIGGTPSFANGETWEVNIKNGVVVGGLVE